MLSVNPQSLFLAPVGSRFCYTLHNASTSAYSDCSACDQPGDITSPAPNHAPKQQEKALANCILIIRFVKKHDSVRMN